VFTARYGLCTYIKQICFFFKRLRLNSVRRVERYMNHLGYRIQETYDSCRTQKLYNIHNELACP
jgi:hypothetical protein